MRTISPINVPSSNLLRCLDDLARRVVKVTRDSTEDARRDNHWIESLQLSKSARCQVAKSLVEFTQRRKENDSCVSAPGHEHAVRVNTKLIRVFHEALPLVAPGFVVVPLAVQHHQIRSP